MNITVMNGACEDYEFDVAELVDGTLAPEKARIVRLHLAGCARCRRWRDEYAAIDARLTRALPQPRLPADFEWKLAARLRARALDCARRHARSRGAGVRRPDDRAPRPAPIGDARQRRGRGRRDRLRAGSRAGADRAPASGARHSDGFGRLQDRDRRDHRRGARLVVRQRRTAGAAAAPLRLRSCAPSRAGRVPRPSGWRPARCADAASPGRPRPSPRDVRHRDARACRCLRAPPRSPRAPPHPS